MRISNSDIKIDNLKLSKINKTLKAQIIETYMFLLNSCTTIIQNSEFSGLNYFMLAKEGSLYDFSISQKCDTFQLEEVSISPNFNQSFSYWFPIWSIIRLNNFFSTDITNSYDSIFLKCVSFKHVFEEFQGGIWKAVWNNQNIFLYGDSLI